MSSCVAHALSTAPERVLRRVKKVGGKCMIKIEPTPLAATPTPPPLAAPDADAAPDAAPDAALPTPLPTPLPTLDFQVFARSSVSTAVTAVGVRTVCRSGCVLFIMLFNRLRSLSRCSSCCFEASKRSLSFRITLPCLLITSCWSSFFDTKGTAQFSLVAVAI